MDKIYNEILKILNKEQIFLNEQMSNHTTFKIGGPADIFVKPKSITELKNVIKIAKQNSLPITVIGNGSNVLVKDRRNKRNNNKTRFYRHWIFRKKQG